MNKNDSFNSRHFRLEQLAEGVYAAINADDGWAISNAGIIDLGDRTLVYDAFMSPAAASDLREAAERLMGRQVHLLINSHYHNDHIWGNQVFPAETDIISSVRTRELIITEGTKEIQECRQVGQERLATLETQFKNASDEATQDLLKLHITYFQAINTTMPILQVRLPNITFNGEMTFGGSRRSARLITYEGGHCGSDTILYLPDDGIVYMEDLLFSGFHPYLAEGDPYEIQRILSQVRKLQANTFVPGHGPVGDATHLDWMDGYINCLNSLAGEVVKKGGTEAELDSIDLPGEYQHLTFPNIFRDNLKLLYRRQLDKGG